MIGLLRMIEQEFDDFNEERAKHKGLKSLVDFSSTVPNYEGSEVTLEVKPVFKKKLISSVYIKEDKSKGQLF